MKLCLTMFFVTFRLVLVIAKFILLCRKIFLVMKLKSKVSYVMNEILLHKVKLPHCSLSPPAGTWITSWAGARRSRLRVRKRWLRWRRRRWSWLSWCAPSCASTAGWARSDPPSRWVACRPSLSPSPPSQPPAKQTHSQLLLVFSLLLLFYHMAKDLFFLLHHEKQTDSLKRWVTTQQR